MILSVCMIVKNEEKYLRQCLTALSPVLTELKSELIIADTGSTDQTVDIAREFTTNVFHFEWCNDFSAARNATLEKAKGKWVMTIDADEILEDADELILFFQSGEYKKYNSAMFIVRNAVDSELKNSSDAYVPRLTKMTPNTRYKNAIHEELTTFAAPVKKLQVVFNHFGYVSKDNEEFMKQKAERNIHILQESWKKNPSDPMICLHLCQSYRMAAQSEKALEFCGKGIELAKSQNSQVQYPLYLNKFDIYSETQRYEEALSVAKKYFASRDKKIGTDLEFYFIQAQIYHKLKKYDQAIESFEKYTDYFKNYRKGLLHTPDTLLYSVSFVDEPSYLKAISSLAFLNIKKGDFKSAQTILQRIQIKTEQKDASFLKDFLIYQFEIMHNLKDFSDLLPIYRQLNEENLLLLLDLIETDIHHVLYRNLILKEFKNTGQSDDYIRLNQLRYDYYVGQTLTKGAAEDFINKLERWDRIFADWIYFALALKMPLDFIASKVDPYDLKEALFLNPFFHFENVSVLAMENYENVQKQVGANAHLWLSALFLNTLLSNRYENDKAEKLFEVYSSETYAYLKFAFKPEILTTENAHMLPKPFRSGFYGYLAANAQKNGQNSEYIKNLRLALLQIPSLKPAVEIMLDRFQKKLKTQEKKEPLSELEQYAVTIKDRIISLIVQGNFEQAGLILNQYEQICPSDPDVPELRNRIK